MSSVRKKVLLVEDHDDCRELLSILITRLGYDVIEAASGLEGIYKASTAHPDLILMDVALPGINGIEATSQLKTHPSTRDIPVIINTAFADPEHARQAMDTGAAEILCKPFGLTAFHKVLERYLSNDDPQRETVAEASEL